MLAYASMSELSSSQHPESVGAKFERLVEIMRRLRAPDGCPWDREQTLVSLRPFLIEETYEVLEAIDREDNDGLRGELGDLFFEAVFLTQLSTEAGFFTIVETLDEIIDKLVRRHPHVFEPGASTGAPLTSVVVKRRWEEIKEREQECAGKRPSLLGGIPASLPSLLQAYRIGKRTATVGFDWKHLAEVMEKVDEELAEVKEAIEDGSRMQVTEELGDLLFVVANLARHLGVEPEGALRDANRKFSKRFGSLEQRFRDRGITLRDTTLDEMESEWQRIKAEG